MDISWGEEDTILPTTLWLPVLSWSQDGCCISCHHVCIQERKGGEGLQDCTIWVYAFLSGKQKLSQWCPNRFYISWMRTSSLGQPYLATCEAGNVLSRLPLNWEVARQKAGVNDSRKHVNSICHSPLPISELRAAKDVSGDADTVLASIRQWLSHQHFCFMGRSVSAIEVLGILIGGLLRGR